MPRHALAEVQHFAAVIGRAGRDLVLWRQVALHEQQALVFAARHNLRRTRNHIARIVERIIIHAFLEALVSGGQGDGNAVHHQSLDAFADGLVGFGHRQFRIGQLLLLR